MQLTVAPPTDSLPWPPMRTLADARVGLERGLSAAGVAAWSPHNTDAAHLRAVSGVVVEAAAIIEAAATAHPHLDLPAAAAQARAGAAQLQTTAHLLDQVRPTPPGTDPYAAVSAAAEQAFATLKSAFLTAGGS